MRKFSKEYGISIETLKKIRSFFNDRKWKTLLKENPYALMEMDGFSFRRCDIIAKKLNFDMKSPYRVKACVGYILENTTKGDTILPLFTILSKLSDELMILDQKYLLTLIMVESAKYKLLDDKCKVVKDLESITPTYITLTDWYESEKFFYNWLKGFDRVELLKKDENIINSMLDNNKSLNKEQQRAVECFLDRNVNTLIGVSGGGKSYTTKTILDLLDAHGYSYTLLAPTGIASFNLTEKTSRPSSTIHRRYYSKQPITTDFVVIDEFGMCGCNHLHMLKELITDTTKTRPLLIGDKYQLPPIQAGDFLGTTIKLIQNGKIDGNIFELVQIMRASSESYIPHLSNMFCGNNRFNDRVILDKNLKGVKFELKKDDMFKQIENIITKRGWDLKETSIIMPQRKGNLGCDKLNEYFQSKNESEVLYEDDYKIFKRNDIMMHIKNNSKLDIFNGELIKLMDKRVQHTIEDDGTPSEVNIYIVKRLYDNKILEYDEQTLKDQTMLSYANSVHKTQGATIKNVIFVAIKEFSFMLTRNLTYVGLSRASDNLVVLCDSTSLKSASFKNLTDTRKTFLGILSR